MSASTAVPTTTQTWKDSGPMFHAIGTLAVGASALTYTAGGIALNFNSAVIKASRTPQFVIIIGQAGYQYTYINGTDNSNGKLMIRAQKASATDHDALTELGDGVAIPSGVSGDTIRFHAMWLGMN